MKKTDLKEKSSVLIIGRGFIIVAIFITSSLSFTLGYFVGKSGHSRVENQQFSPALQERIEQKNIAPEAKDAVSQQSEQPQKTLQPETQHTQETSLAQEIKKPIETKPTQETAKVHETKETVKSKGKTKTPQKIKYTVQVGAFTDASEADALKTKLNKKGYKAYVTQSESKNDKKLFKVKIGEFNTKNKAELLSIKIRKTEGLQTFSTFKTEKEDVR
ncbi:MAG: SPOR domain-containing protein [Nitrospirota bacterium]|nr:SPOR domain-containing protein [Nitrospirota bacterium]MDH5767609.1 SPOR domain-containing protein [Nitrospirota bacterium]